MPYSAIMQCRVVIGASLSFSYCTHCRETFSIPFPPCPLITSAERRTITRMIVVPMSLCS